jgi:hypothetical protein
MMKHGSLVDATIIEAPNSTKNKRGESDPEMHQSKKGNQWYFGMKAHIGVDAKSGLTYSLETTLDNEQRDAIAARDVGERRPYAPPVNQEGHGLAADVDIHALAPALEGGALAGLWMFAGHLDSDVLGHLTPPAWFQNGGSQRPPLGRY